MAAPSLARVRAYTKAVHTLGAPRVSRCGGCNGNYRAVLPLPGNPKRYLRICLVCDLAERLPFLALPKRKAT